MAGIESLLLFSSMVVAFAVVEVKLVQNAGPETQGLHSVAARMHVEPQKFQKEEDFSVTGVVCAVVRAT